MPTIALYPFRFYDPMRRRWYRAQYVATIERMVERYAAVQVLGKPEIRNVAADWRELTAGHCAR